MSIHGKPGPFALHLAPVSKVTAGPPLGPVHRCELGTRRVRKPEVPAFTEANPTPLGPSAPGRAGLQGQAPAPSLPGCCLRDSGGCRECLEDSLPSSPAQDGTWDPQALSSAELTRRAGEGHGPGPETHLTTCAHILSGQQELPKGHERRDEDNMETYLQVSEKQEKEEGNRQQYL